jgi:hypothetical protein
VPLRGREDRSVGEWCRAEHAPEARGERADAGESDGEADLGHGAIGVAQQRRRPLEAAGQEVLVWRLTERAPKLTAEMSG